RDVLRGPGSRMRRRSPDRGLSHGAGRAAHCARGSHGQRRGRRHRRRSRDSVRHARPRSRRRPARRCDDPRSCAAHRPRRAARRRRFARRGHGRLGRRRGARALSRAARRARGDACSRHDGSMTQPIYGGRPLTPAPGAPTPELRVARFRTHARRLFWSALVLVAVAGAVGYFYGNLPAPFENWMLLTAAAVVVFLLVLLPFLAWWSHVYTITTRRVIE